MSAIPIILIDGSSYLYRAFHALPPLVNSKGEATGAIFGVANMVKKLRAQYQPEKMAVIFDAKGKTFRSDIYPDYKAHRPPMPPELRTQIEPLHAIIKAMGIPLLCIQGVEADDVIGTLAHQATQQKIDVVISSGDKDLTQLVNEHISLINTMTNKKMDRAAVIEKFGVPPELIIDYFTLVGDTADNIPGVPNVGPKTAAKWLNAYGNLDGVIEHADEIKGKVGENFRAHFPLLPIAKQLVTIKCDIDLGLDLQDLALHGEDTPTLKSLYQALEFNSWFKEENAPITTVQTVTLSEAMNDIQATKTMIFSMHGLTFSLALPHHKLFATTELTLFKSCFENPSIKKIGHDIKKIILVLAKQKIRLAGIEADTMLESYVCNSVAGPHDTEHENALLTEKLHASCSSTLRENKNLDYIFQDIEMPLVPILARMEQEGVLVDSEKLAAQTQDLAARLSILEEKAFQLAGEVFNLQSPNQLQVILYEKLALPILKKTPKGQPSTAESVLTELAFDYPLPKLIIEHRQLSKLKSTYTDQLPKQVNSETGRIHSSFHQAVTATGRLSSSDPNLQNIPIRTEEGRRIRQAFIAAPGYRLISADYSQIELRIMAHLSQDASLLSAFQQNLDIHTATASEIFGIALHSVTDAQRRSAKAINFGLIYGMSAFGLAKQLNIEPQMARRHIERYFERYPGVLHYMNSTRKQAHEQGYVETLFGRRLYLPSINTSNKIQQQAAERMAINAPMQGTAADIIKLAMIAIDPLIQEESHSIKLIMQVHDELVFEVLAPQATAYAEKIKQGMEQAAELSVPLIVDVGIGDNWDEAH